MPTLSLRGGPFNARIVVSRNPNAIVPDILGFDRGGVCDFIVGDFAFAQWQMKNLPATPDEVEFPAWATRGVDYKCTDRLDEHGRISFVFAPPSDVTLKLRDRLGTDVLMARAQAKQVLAGMEEIAKLHLDFEGIESVGPSFADEAFRVWENEHPESLISYTNASPDVEAMIRRVREG